MATASSCRCAHALAVLPWEKVSRKGPKKAKDAKRNLKLLCSFAPLRENYLAIVDAVVVACGVPKFVVSGTFSIVNLIRSSTTALRSFVSR